jgi:hypothetical protein
MKSETWKPGTKVKCIDGANSYRNLIQGKVYVVVTHDPKHAAVKVACDVFPGQTWCDSRFAPVGCPCSIANCVALHDKI